MRPRRSGVARLVALLLLATAATFVAASLQLSLGTTQKPGPGVVPLVSAVFLGLAAVTALVGRRRADEGEPPAGAAARAVLVVAALVLVYPAALAWLGFSIATVALVWGAARALDLPARPAGLLAVGTVGVSVLLFRVALDVPLPTGLVGF
ncbi:MAG: tripartite tricarboxylate transporter TctB family protein [Rhodovulum sp.]|nr:tripartite tricarboxylate transporter TctB family protein [Rhodovulum sp.]